MKKSELRQIIREELQDKDFSPMSGHVLDARDSMEDVVDSFKEAVKKAPKEYSSLGGMKKLLKELEKIEQALNFEINHIRTAKVQARKSK